MATKAHIVDADRQARWEAFLEKAEKVNPRQHGLNKANGEFDKIPDSFN